MLLLLSFYVVLGKIAVLTHASGVVRLVVVATGICHFALASSMVAIMTHVFCIMFAVCVWAHEDLTLLSLHGFLWWNTIRTAINHWTFYLIILAIHWWIFIFNLLIKEFTSNVHIHRLWVAILVILVIWYCILVLFYVFKRSRQQYSVLTLLMRGIMECRGIWIVYLSIKLALSFLFHIIMLVLILFWTLILLLIDEVNL